MENDHPRMLDWLIISLAFFVGSMMLRWSDVAPQVQTAFWKFGLLCAASYLGYWIDRHLYRDRITDTSSDLRHIRRAIIVVGAMVAVALGL